jgi:predicted extracellular nuclease
MPSQQFQKPHAKLTLFSLFCTIAMLLLITAGKLSTANASSIIAQWTFEGDVTTPAQGAGTAALVGGTTATFATGNPSGRGWNTTNYPAQNVGNKSAGVQFAVNTTGYQDIIVSWQQRHSNTANNTTVLQASADGIAFTDVFTFTFTPAATGTGDTWYDRTVDLSGLPQLDNNPNALFRIVSAFDPTTGAYRASRSTSNYATTGTWRFDNVTVSGTATGDSAPAVQSTSPANNASAVSTDASVTVTFSEPIDVIGDWLFIACPVSGGRTTTDVTVSGGPTVFTVDPIIDFANGERCTMTVNAANVTDRDADDPPDAMLSDHTFSFTTLALSYRIHDIQGAAHTSPLVPVILDNATSNGQAVIDVEGIVTALRGNGFYIQEPDATVDSDPATSEAIFVFTGSAPTAAVGDRVQVDGVVAEFRSGCTSASCTPTSSAWQNLTLTEIVSSNSAVTVLSTGNPLPSATIIGAGGRTPPTQIIHDDPTAPGASVETDPAATASFEPSKEGLDFYESLEGMLVQVNNAIAVGPTQVFGSGASLNREIPVLADGGGGQGVRTARGGIVISASDFNPERIILGDALNSSNPDLPTVNVGDVFSGAIIGVLDYSFANFKLLTSESLPPVVAGGLTKQTLGFPAPAVDELSIATFNVENLDPGDGSRFAALANVIVNHLASPDILALEEVQDNNGPISDTVVAADVTLNTLITAIINAGGPPYQFRVVDPVAHQDGGEPGGNIRVAFLFRTDRGVGFADRPGATATTSNVVQNISGAPALQFNPGRVDPTNPAFVTSRKPLAGEFTYGGRKLFLIANHFNSKGGDHPLFGRLQPPVLSSEAQRNQQAAVVASFVNQIRAIDPDARIVVLGDMNDFEFSPPVSTLEAAGLTTLIERLPANRRYSYNYQGNAQSLDHILVSQSVLNAFNLQYQVVHVNSEFADQLSDHDPQVVRFSANVVPALIARSTYNTGLGANGAEIIDLREDIAGLTNAGDGSVDILDVSNVLQPSLTQRITGFSELNSLALHPTQDYFLAVAGSSKPAAAPVIGKVRAYRISDGTLLAEADTGILPDSIDISPDGKWAVVANEAESEAVNDNGGPGSLTVINLSGFDPDLSNTLEVVQVALPSQNGTPGFSTNRIDDIGRLPIDNTPGTLEPESVAFSSDSQYAYITLQENNGLVRIKLADQSLSFFGLGQTTHVVDSTNGNGYNPNSQLTMFREPDGVAIFEINGQRYFATADEGDTRDDIAPAVTSGRLRGGRTVSIFNADTGELLGDTGNQIDALSARMGIYPDNRSDRGGSEPEVLDATVFAGRALVAVGLERANAIALVDVTDPVAPHVFQAITSGVGPEGVKFVEQDGQLFVLSANEVDGTVTIATAPVAPLALTQEGVFNTPLALYDLNVIDADAGDRIDVLLALDNPLAGALSTSASAADAIMSDLGGGQYQVAGAVNGVNTLLAGLIFTPASDFYGTVTAAISVTDGFAAPVLGALAIVIPAPPTLTIIKDAQPDSGFNFRFTAAPVSGALPGDFMLDNPTVDDNDGVPNSRSFELANGVYTVRELVPAGWHLADIHCSTGAVVNKDLATASATITLNGADVTCTFIDTQDVTVQSSLYYDRNGNGRRDSRESGLGLWTVTATNLQSMASYKQVTNAIGRANFNFLPAGAYKVCVVLIAGWINTQPQGAEPCYTANLMPGQLVLLTFGLTVGVAVAAEDAPATNDTVAIIDSYTHVPDDSTYLDLTTWVDPTLETPLAENDAEGVDVTPRLFLPMIVR